MRNKKSCFFVDSIRIFDRRVNIVIFKTKATRKKKKKHNIREVNMFDNSTPFFFGVLDVVRFVPLSLSILKTRKTKRSNTLHPSYACYFATAAVVFSSSNFFFILFPFFFYINYTVYISYCSVICIYVERV